MGNKKRRLYSKASVICFVAVISLGLMGICYGAWNSNMFLGISLSTGSINPEFEIIQAIIADKDGELTLSLSDDNKTLFIDGWCYPTFEADIPIRIFNRGSIPVKPFIKSGDIGNKEKEENTPNSAINAYIEHLPKELEGGSSQDVTIQLIAKDLLKEHLPQAEEVSSGSPGLDIQSFIEKLQQEEEHAFTFDLQFDQSN